MADPNSPVPPGGVPPKPPEAAQVQPKKETVRIALPPKPTSAPTIKLPSLPATGAAPVAGNDGSLIVGAEVGLGGSAMRTVSFFGCTWAASGGFGGTPPGGTGEFGSAIKSIVARTYWRGKSVSNC